MAFTLEEEAAALPFERDGFAGSEAIGGYSLAAALGALFWIVLRFQHFTHQPEQLAMAGVACAGSFCAMWFAPRRRVLAGSILLLSTWTAVSGAIAMRGSFEGPPTPGLFVVLILSVIIFRGAGAVVAVMLMAGTALLAYLPEVPVANAKEPFGSEYGHLVSYAAATAVMMGIAFVYVRCMRRREQATQRIAAAFTNPHTHRANGAEESRLAEVGRLTAGVTHDVANLLQVIERHLTDATSGDANEASLRDARDASSKAVRVARRVLALARDDEGTPGPIDFGELVRDLAGLVRSNASRGVEVRVEVDPGTLWVHGDAIQLARLVLNLCSNAAAALPDRGELEVSLRRDGDSVRLEVVDDGLGMSSAVLERCFEPGYTSRAASGGSGLGLTIVQDIVRRHEGSVEIDSAPGEGTRVTIRLPRIQPAAPVDARADFVGARILVVDDERGIRSVMRRLLLRQGYEVTLAGSANEARARIAEAATPNLALIDVGLRNESGEELLRDLRSELPDLPCIVMSGDPHRAREAASLADGVLEKPFRDGDLLELVHSCLSGAPQE